MIEMLGIKSFIVHNQILEEKELLGHYNSSGEYPINT